MYICLFFLLSESSRLKYKSFLSECCLQQCQQYSCSLSADATYFLLQNLQRGRTELYVSGGRNIKRSEANFFLNYYVWQYFENEYEIPSVFRSGCTTGTLDANLLLFHRLCGYLSDVSGREIHVLYAFYLFLIIVVFD